MNLKKYEVLKDSRIAKVLDGDITLGNFETSNKGSYFFDDFNLELSMPRLSGPDICDIAKKFELKLKYAGGMKSRVDYMFDLIDCGISSGKISSILAYLFDESNFTRDINLELSKIEVIN